MLVEADKLEKKLGNFLLSEISFSLPQGYICGLVGRNGAGKTTLLHLLLGLYRPDRGELRIAGKAYKKESREVLDSVGTVLQEPLFDAERSLIENARFFGSYYRQFDFLLMRKYLQSFELGEKKRYAALSKGEQLKFQFAFALSHKPRLLILDEPTGNFDPQFRNEFFRLLKEFIASGENSVILATHATGDLDRLADYILYLDKGRQRFFMDVETLRDSYRMVQGETYKINLLKRDRVLYIEEGSLGSKALVTAGKNSTFDKALTVWRPTLEELIYSLEKRKQ